MNARQQAEIKRLNRISQATAEKIADWKEGVSIAEDFGSSIDDVMLRVAIARWRLAAEHLRDANLLRKSTRPVFRSIVSRYYYAMYHAFRACCFVYHRGDDHQSHTDLHRMLPVDFPSVDTWKNRLKNARLTRNRAEYDAYPRSAAAWRKQAVDLQRDSREALKATMAYLQGKGCKL
jgi:uncharacterized protein (UPF0332 family)